MMLFASCQQQTTSSTQSIISEPVVITFNFAPESVSKSSEFSTTIGIINNGDYKIPSGDFRVKVIQDYFSTTNPEVSSSEELDKQSNAIITLDNIEPNVEIPQNEMQRLYDLNLEYRFLYGGSSDAVMCFVNPITQYDARKKPICSSTDNKISNSKNYVMLTSIDIATGQNYANVVFNLQKVNSNVKLLGVNSVDFDTIRTYLTDKYKGDKESILLKFNALPSYVDASNSYCLIPNAKGGVDNIKLSDMSSNHKVFLSGGSAQIKCKFVLNKEGKENLDAPNYGFKSYIQLSYQYVVMGKLSKSITVINEG